MLGLSASAFAADKEAIKDHLENHFQLYGFIRNYFAFDTRESKAGTADLFYWVPLDENINDEGKDLNANMSFRFLSLTSRLGVNVKGYTIAGLEFGAKIEADFYAGLSGSTGTATFRMRQAYMTMTKNALGRNGRQSSVLKVGQAWHPIGADMPDIYSLETGAPFGPFSRTPMVLNDYDFGNGMSLAAGMIWQMQYTSSGPDGSSADYMKYGLLPELYIGLSYKKGGFLGRVGYDFLSIKPRKTNDARMNASMGFVYLQYKKNLFTAKAKSTFGQAGEHLGLMSGYLEYSENGKTAYEALLSSSSWLSLSYGKKFVGSLFLGYNQNFGTPNERTWTALYFNKNTGIGHTLDITGALAGKTVQNKMFRIEPEFTYNLGKFTVGIEYMLTAAQYGSFIPGHGDDISSVDLAGKKGLAMGKLHWVMNHRVQAMVKFNF